MFFLSCVCYAFLRVCLFGALWSHAGSGVVLDCIDSLSLHPYFYFQSLSGDEGIVS